MRGFWVSLPHTICNDEKMAADVTNDDRCWNGQTRGRYVRVCLCVWAGVRMCEEVKKGDSLLPI